jgi:hypothetical protein
LLPEIHAVSATARECRGQVCSTHVVEGSAVGISEATAALLEQRLLVGISVNPKPFSFALPPHIQ